MDVVTSGMYDDPLMVYREYVQNSVDSIDVARDGGLLGPGKGRVEIDISGRTRRVTVQDDGTGVPAGEIERCLVALGCSNKARAHRRGFRGIGRLGGLAYCDLLRFETRASRREPVTVVEWDGKKLRSLALSAKGAGCLISIVSDVVRVYERRPARDDPAHFLRVRMENVHPFHSDELMNLGAVRDYLSQVAPVPYNSAKFSFTKRIKERLSGMQGYRSYDVFLNGKQVRRPYADLIRLSRAKADRIKDVRLFELPDRRGGMLGVGWYAETGFEASLPADCAMRGIRIRQGNLQIGDEHFLEDAFAERRFATWHIGEIHLTDNVMKPNARRDDFEQSPEYERLLEHAAVLGRHLSTLCRRASKRRSSRLRLERKLRELERLADTQLWVDDEHRQSIVRAIEEGLQRLDGVSPGHGLSKGSSKLVARVRRNLKRLKLADGSLERMLDGRSLRHVDGKALLSEIARSILEGHEESASVGDLISRVLSPYFRESARRKMGQKRR